MVFTIYFKTDQVNSDDQSIHPSDRRRKNRYLPIIEYKYCTSEVIFFFTKYTTLYLHVHLAITYAKHAIETTTSTRTQENRPRACAQRASRKCDRQLVAVLFAMS